MSREDAEHRLRLFERGHESALLRLASHAALPVVLNPDFVHLLRVNYFLDPPVTLPYTAEAELLLSPLCTEVDQGLYVIDPDLRDVLLQHLITEHGTARLHDVARLLWEYGQRGTPWSDRPGLPEAQQLSALNFIDPSRAQDWLTRAEAEAGEGTPADERWFVAIRRDLESRAAAVAQAQERADAATGMIPAFAALPVALANTYPAKAQVLTVASLAGIDTTDLSEGAVSPTALWKQVLATAWFTNTLPALLEAAGADGADEALAQAIEECRIRLSPAVQLANGQIVALEPEWEVLAGHREQIRRTVTGFCLIAGPDQDFRTGATGFLAGRRVVLTLRSMAVDRDNVWLAFADRHNGLPSVPAGASGRVPGLIRARVTRVNHIGTDLAALALEVNPEDEAAMPAPLELAAPPPELTGRKVYVLGYPSLRGDMPHFEVTARIFNGVSDALCLQPGEIVRADSEEGWIIHNCFALRENEGSPLVDLVTGQVLGLHYTAEHSPGKYGLRIGTAVALPPDIRDRIRALDEEALGLSQATETIERDFPLSRSEVDLLLRELASIYSSEERAVTLLRLIHYPSRMMPTWRNAFSFWADIFHELKNGVMEMPYRRLIAAALRTYGSNTVLADLQRRHQQTDAQEARAADLPLSQSDIELLLRELARIYSIEARALSFLRLIQFPRELIPVWGNALSFWAQIFEELSHGVMSAPYKRLINQAARAYSSNLVLAELQRRYQAPPTTPEEAALDTTCHVVVWAQAEERAGIEAWLAEHGLAPEPVWISPSSMSFRVNEPDPRAVEAIMNTHPRLLNFKIVPPGQRNYVIRQFFVEGPDGRSFRFSDVPSVVAVDSVAEELIDQYPEGFPGSDTATVVDAIGPDGSPRRMNPDSSLLEEGIAEDSRLRVAFQRGGSVTLPKDPMQDAPGYAGDAGGKPSPDSRPPLDGRIRVGGPHGILLSPKDVATDPELSRFIDEHSKDFYLVQLGIDFGPNSATPRLDSVTVTLRLTSVPATPAPVAISMRPTPTRGNFLQSIGEGTNQPAWEFKETASTRVVGVHRLVMIVMAEAGSVVSVNGVVTARTTRSIFRRRMSQLSNPLLFGATI